MYLSWYESSRLMSCHSGDGEDALGRHGWLSRVQLGIVDYEGKLYLDQMSGRI